jgi:hypothetical protein
MARIRVGDVGTRFALTLRPDGAPSSVLDISSASVLHLDFKKPDGTIVMRIASFATDGTDGTVEWTTTSISDLDQDGPWFWQAYAEVGGTKFHSDVLQFDVLPNLAVT